MMNGGKPQPDFHVLALAVAQVGKAARDATSA